MLPEDCLLLVANLVYHADLLSALNLCAACRGLRARLDEVRERVEARRLQWVEELTDVYKLVISDEGLALYQGEAPSAAEMGST